MGVEFGGHTWNGVEYRLETFMDVGTLMTQDLMFWRGLLEPVLICCWDGPLKMSE